MRGHEPTPFARRNSRAGSTRVPIASVLGVIPCTLGRMAGSAGYDDIVLGLGGMGSAAAYHLARRGRRVLGIEQFTPAHDRGSSHGRSRIYRQAYVEGTQYVPLLLRAYELWRELERESGRELLRLTGGLMIGREGSRTIAGATASAQRHGLPHEILAHAELRRRFPVFETAPDEVALYEPTAGALFPEDAVRAHLDLAAAQGAALRFETPVIAWQADAGGVRVTTSDGSFHADRLVVAAGAWAGRLLADLGLPLRPERNVLCWWRPKAQPEAFESDRLPIFIWEQPDRDLYGIPNLRGEGVKAGFHHSDEDADPDAQRRAVDGEDVAAVRTRLERCIPALPGELLDAATCMYTNTPDEHFVIGMHPALPRVAIAAGFSGHGFKFTTVVGEALADLCVTGATALPIAPFRPNRFVRPEADGP